MDDTRKTMQWLKSIKEKYIHGGDDDYDDKRRLALDEAIRVMGLLANGVTVQQWIPVTERLPEENGEYLVHWMGDRDSKFVKVLSFANEGYWELKGRKNVWFDYDSEWGLHSYDGVTHWMPLPEPPKEGE